MRKLYFLMIAVVAIMILGMPLKAQFVLTSDANANPFVPAEGKWYRIATTGANAWNDPLKYVYGNSVTSTVKLSAVTTTDVEGGTVTGLEFMWVFEAHPTVANAFYIKNVGTGTYMNNNGGNATVTLGAKVDAVYNTFDVRTLHKTNTGTQSYELYEGYLIKAGSNRTLQPWGDYRWNSFTGGLDRADCYMFLQAVDASTDSAAKLALKSEIASAKIVQTTGYPENTTTNAANATLVAAIADAEATLANVASDDAAYTSATTTLSDAVTAYNSAIKPWVDLNAKIMVVDAKIAFVAPATGGTAFLNYTQASVDALTTAGTTAKTFLLNGNAGETGDALVALNTAYDTFVATPRVAPLGGAYYAVYSWGVINGDGETMNKKYMQATSVGEVVTVDAVLSPTSSEVAFTDNMLWAIAEVEGGGYSFQNKALGTYLELTSGIAMNAIAVGLTLRDGTPASGTTIKKGNDDNYCYFMVGTAERSPQIGATNTTVTPNTIALLMNGIADRMRYQWSFMEAELSSVAINYLDANDVVLKPERVVSNLLVGNMLAATDADKADIVFESETYVFDTQSTASVKVATGNAATITLRFAKAIPTSIKDVSAAVVTKKYYSITGVEVEADTIGTLIEQVVYSDGSVKMTKIVNRNR